MFNILQRKLRTFSLDLTTVICLFNQNKNEILDTIKEFASKEDSTRFICFLSSHGDNTSLVCPRNAYGEENVKIRDMLKCANTPQLKDCPKIFFIDACRKYYHYTCLLCGVA